MSQLENWERAARLKPYLAAMEQFIQECSKLEDSESAQGWFIWDQSYVHSLDPITNELSMPEEPVPTEKAFEPFTQGIRPPRGW